MQSHVRASQVARAERRAEAAVRHAFEALQLAERNEVEERELLQTLGAFLDSGLIDIPPPNDSPRPLRAGMWSLQDVHSSAVSFTYFPLKLL